MKDEERTPLRSVLRNFLNHIENLESQSLPEKSYETEFQDLKLFSENVKSLKEYSCLEGEKEINRKKNRYKDILPFDLSRVVLNEYAGIPGSDYINANYIKGASGSPAYIASQGPLPSTVNDFWRMVVQCEVQVIVMACNEEEAGKAKCEKYWVDDGEEKKFGMISVKLLKSSTVCSDFSVRTMRLKYSNSQSIIEERTVCQLHYVAWPDHGVPSVVHPLLDMVRLVRDTQASETLPVLVHCSAGCGRTGTICAIDYVWGLLRTGKLTKDFSLLSLIREMRKQRIAMVQTKEQYVLVHQAVRELFKEQLCMIDSHPYENVDHNGLLILKEDEHLYDTIDSMRSSSSEEKQDSKKEKETAPPLPKKKHHTLFSSKHEKEVENLSAQQRAIHKCLPKSEVERHTHNKSLESVLKDSTSKKLSPKPIPSKGILRVPQISPTSTKVAASIKRSKSLKIPSTDKQKLNIYKEVPPIEPAKRRASLESNFEESFSDLNIGNNEKTECITSISVPQSVKKYEALNLSERRPLVRSHTTLETRVKSQNPTIIKTPQSIKVKLSRSNTQIDFSKISLSTPKKNHLPLDSRFDPTFKKQRTETPTSSKINGNLSYRFQQTDIKDLRKVKPKPMPSNYPIQMQRSLHKMGNGNYGEPSTSSDILNRTFPTSSRTVEPAKLKTNGLLDYSSRHFYNPKIQRTPENHLRRTNYAPPPPNYYFNSKPEEYHSPYSRQLYGVVKTGPPKSNEPIDLQMPNYEIPSTSVQLRQNKHVIIDPEWRFGLHERIAKTFTNGSTRLHSTVQKEYPHQSQSRSDYFLSAPGVDLDKVAASIPQQKDGSKSNLMKAALEAFNLRKNRQQSRRLPAEPPVQSPNRMELYGGVKKKQQQYL